LNVDAALLSFLFNGSWAAFLVLLDRRARQSPFMLAFALAMGMTAAAAVLMAKSWMDPSVLRPGFIPDWVWRDYFEAGTLEETIKAILFLVMAWALRPKDPARVFLLAAFVGAGFALTENMGYILQGAFNSLASDPEAYYRTIISVAVARSVPTHAAFTGIPGFVLAYAMFYRPIRGHFYLVLPALLASILLHGTWNALSSGFFLEKYIGVMALLVLMAWGVKALTDRLNPSFMIAWKHRWIALAPIDHLGKPQSKKLETLLAAMAAFVYSLLMVNLLVAR